MVYGLVLGEHACCEILLVLLFCHSAAVDVGESLLEHNRCGGKASHLASEAAQSASRYQVVDAFVLSIRMLLLADSQPGTPSLTLQARSR